MRENPRWAVNVVVGFTMVALGLLFLVDQLLPVSIWRYSWPFFVLIPGLLFFVGMVLGGRGTGWLAIPGSITTTVGLILLYQNITGHYESWAYAWALIFPSAIGVGQVIQGTWNSQPRLVADGLRWARMGAVIFLLGGLFFEVVLDFGRGGFGRIVWPLMLIAAGAYLLFRQGGINPARMPERPVEETPPAEQPSSVAAPAAPRADGVPARETGAPAGQGQMTNGDEDEEEL